MEYLPNTIQLLEQVSRFWLNHPVLFVIAVAWFIIKTN